MRKAESVVRCWKKIPAKCNTINLLFEITRSFLFFLFLADNCLLFSDSKFLYCPSSLPVDYWYKFPTLVLVFYFFLLLLLYLKLWFWHLSSVTFWKFWCQWIAPILEDMSNRVSNPHSFSDFLILTLFFNVPDLDVLSRIVYYYGSDRIYNFVVLGYISTLYKLYSLLYYKNCFHCISSFVSVP